MESIPRSIEYYKDESGKRPFITWLDAQEIYVRHRIGVRFKHVEQGNFGVHHGEGEGVFALIFDFGPGYRVYYGLTEDKRVVLLLAGGTKKRQDKVIGQARKHWQDYKKNNKEA